MDEISALVKETPKELPYPLQPCEDVVKIKIQLFMNQEVGPHQT